MRLIPFAEDVLGEDLDLGVVLRPDPSRAQVCLTLGPAQLAEFCAQDAAYLVGIRALLGLRRVLGRFRRQFHWLPRRLAAGGLCRCRQTCAAARTPGHHRIPEGIRRPAA